MKNMIPFEEKIVKHSKLSSDYSNIIYKATCTKQINRRVINAFTPEQMKQPDSVLAKMYDEWLVRWKLKPQIIKSK